MRKLGNVIREVFQMTEFFLLSVFLQVNSLLSLTVVRVSFIRMSKHKGPIFLFIGMAQVRDWMEFLNCRDLNHLNSLILSLIISFT